VVPLIACFGHQPVTGRILQGRSIPDEVKALIRRSNRVFCFVTRASEIYTETGAVRGYLPPGWVRDELMLARGANKEAIEFRETGVIYDGAAPFMAWHEFDRDRLPDLMLRLAQVLKDLPVGPLILRLRVPAALEPEFDRDVQADRLVAECRARENDGAILVTDRIPVRKVADRYVIAFWIKPDPDVSIEVDINYAGRQLVCRGVSPAICIADLLQL
jgi:hypothetical protein